MKATWKRDKRPPPCPVRECKCASLKDRPFCAEHWEALPAWAQKHILDFKKKNPYALAEYLEMVSLFCTALEAGRRNAAITQDIVSHGTE